jgi:hypothetical protein
VVRSVYRPDGAHQPASTGHGVRLFSLVRYRNSCHHCYSKYATFSLFLSSHLLAQILDSQKSFAVVALALSVPSFLLGTAGTISISARALGGIVGITIFTAIFDNKYAAHLKTNVPAAVLSQGYNSAILDEVMGAIASPNPAALQMSGLPKSLIGVVEEALAQARDSSWAFVWVAMACVVIANGVASCFLKSVAPRMNHHIESALEQSEVRQVQLEGKVQM